MKESLLEKLFTFAFVTDRKENILSNTIKK